MPSETTTDMTAEFEEQGYVALPGFLSAEEVKQVNDEIERLRREGLDKIPSEHVFFEDKDDPSTLKQIQHLYRYSPLFEKLMFGSRFEEVAAALLGGEVVGKNMQFFNKPPGVGAPTPPHQDGYYFMLNPPLAVTMWLALEPVDEENGCVRYIPGSHREPMRNHGQTETLGFSQGIVDYGTEDDNRRETPIIAGPGDLLVHHALTIHRADGNRSQSRTRRALGLIYYRTDAKEDKEAHEAYQKKLAEQLKEKGKL